MTAQSRNNTSLRRMIDALIPSWIRPIAHKLYRLIRKSRLLPARRDRNLQLPDSVLRCTIGYNKYGGYCIPLSAKHRPAARAILAFHVYEPDTIEFMAASCGEGDIVHAGTFFGDFLPALSSKCATDARIWAFEPNTENYRCALVTVAINDLENVHLVRAGLGAQRSTLSVQTKDETGISLGGASHIIPRSQAEPGAEDVEIVAIDDVVPTERVVSILQLDVEGYEQQALAGALNTIRRCLPIIILEVLPSSGLTESEWFTEKILALGYRRTHFLHGNQVFQQQEESAAGRSP